MVSFATWIAWNDSFWPKSAASAFFNLESGIGVRSDGRSYGRTLAGRDYRLDSLAG
jgi:hypothetical protein